jgi:tyrosine-protein kinase Etk/Wzc
MSIIKVDKDQFITVTVRATEPETAMRIANEYIDALYRLDHSIAIAAAEHRWEYFEGPLEQEKNKLAAAEEDLKRAQQTTGIVLPDAQVRVGVTALAQLKQEIASREVQLAALRMGSTEGNPRVLQLKSEIANLNFQVARMQAETGGGAAAGARANLPEQALEVQRKAREVKFHETLFEILSRQYENAKVDQSYTPPIEVVDRAVLPDEKSWPPRKMIVILGFIGGGLLGLILVILRVADVTGRWRRVFFARSGASDVPHF